MRCIKCGKGIFKSYGRWYHYTRQHHRAVAPGITKPTTYRETTRIEREIPSPMAWAVIVLLLIIIIVLVLK